jgi:SAM-dependent methyltransferase
MTVGPGIAPDLLTLLALRPKGARGLTQTEVCAYRRWGISPRPENAVGNTPTRATIFDRTLNLQSLRVPPHDASEEFYRGLIALAYAPLRGSVAPSEPFERFVRRHGEPALEIGCGHGERLLDLIAAGLDVVGPDWSADMLVLCLDEAQRRGLAATVVCQRMEEMTLHRKFQSIYFRGPTFQLVIDPDAAFEALNEWREHIFPNGDIVALTTVDQSYRANERRVDSWFIRRILCPEIVGGFLAPIRLRRRRLPKRGQFRYAKPPKRPIFEPLWHFSVPKLARLRKESGAPHR